MRLYLRFYLALLGSLIVFVIAAATIWHRISGMAEHAGAGFGILVRNALPPANAPPEQQQRALERLVIGLDAQVALLGPDHVRIAAVGEPLPRGSHLGGAASSTIELPDGRTLIATVPIGPARPGIALLTLLSVLALAVAVGAYPVVRRLTARLERLQRGVESLGAGDLSARVAVEGNDEVAHLAQSFNRAAARIEDVVGAHKALLANASHELRTPLARIRMAVELMKESAEPKRKASLDADIAELDQLIEEILLASRLDAVAQLDQDEDVDLLALAAEECARFPDAQLDGGAAQIRGDPRLLRRMLRNLLENAARHGLPPTRVHVAQTSGAVEITVSDAGPGIPEDQRERLFEPFFRRPRQVETAGTGLGLALVRQIAQRHAGDVRYAPDNNARSRFIVRLPLVAPICDSH